MCTLDVVQEISSADWAMMSQRMTGNRPQGENFGESLSHPKFDQGDKFCATLTLETHDGQRKERTRTNITERRRGC